MTAGDGVKVADADADGFAGISVCQRGLADTEESLDGSLGSGSGHADTPLEVSTEFRGCRDLRHQCWVVFHFQRFAQRRQKSGQWTPTPPLRGRSITEGSLFSPSAQKTATDSTGGQSAGQRPADLPSSASWNLRESGQ